MCLHGRGSSVSALVTIADKSSMEISAALRVSWNNPLFLNIIRGIGVENTGMVMRIAAARPSDQRMIAEKVEYYGL